MIRSIIDRVLALSAGSLFSIGLLFSGMANPQKVLDFLDVSGNWDASLVFVMLGAILIAFLPFRYALRHRASLWSEPLLLPGRTDIDTKLILGSLLFGIGWGLGGYCPGPAIASLSQPNGPLVAFLVAMTLGLLASGRVAGWLSPARSVGPPPTVPPSRAHKGM